jgi:hypothetical protein
VFTRAFILIPLFLIAVSCNPTVIEEDYNYSFKKVWWSDVIDGNQDGYARFKRLNFNINLLEQVTRKIQARIYYKLKSSSNFTFYGVTQETEVLGNNTDNNLFYSIGAPNKELNRGYYDFSIEVFEINSSRLEVKTDSSKTALLNNAFEESNNDNSFTIKYWWSGIYDRNNNNYWRYATMNIDIDNDNNLTKTVDVNIYYKKSESTAFTLFKAIDNYKVIGKTADTIKYVFGQPELKLTKGEYDFRIEVLRPDINILVALKDQDDPLLNNIRFESVDDDSYYYSIQKVWWSNPVDLDADGFTQNRMLNFDVDVDKNESRTLFAKIYMLHPDSTEYAIYDSTANFIIQGTTALDKYTVGIGSLKTELDSSRYNILISIYDALASKQKVEISTSGSSDTTLYKQKFESVKQDTTRRR